jgi:hypothetical protein
MKCYTLRANERGVALDEMVSELLRDALTSSPSRHPLTGLPLFPVPSDGRRISSNDVRDAGDGD